MKIYIKLYLRMCNRNKHGNMFLVVDSILSLVCVLITTSNECIITYTTLRNRTQAHAR